MSARRMEQLETKVRALERRLCPEMTSDERHIYEEQIAIIREDFLNERRDRERLAAKNLQLTDQLERIKMQYNRLQCRLNALQNMRAYNALQTERNALQSDDVGEENDTETVDV